MQREMRDAFFDPLVDAALENKNIIILAADHTAFSLNRLIEQAPDQFINVGISEQNMISVAAGMALSGKKVFAYGITPFVSLKVLEQFTLDVATLNLDVNIISVGAGFAYCTDGPSHHGMQDINCMLGVPNISVYSCSDPINSELIANKALTNAGPTYIRIEKGMMNTIRANDYKFTGCSSFEDGGQLCFVTSGALVHEVLEASRILQKEFRINSTVFDLYQLKPMPEDTLINYLYKFSNIFTVEENWIQSGFSNHLAKLILENGLKPNLKTKGVEEGFCYEYGSREFLLKKYCLDRNSIALEAKNWLSQ